MTKMVINKHYTVDKQKHQVYQPQLYIAKTIGYERKPILFHFNLPCILHHRSYIVIEVAITKEC